MKEKRCSYDQVIGLSSSCCKIISAKIRGFELNPWISVKTGEFGWKIGGFQGRQQISTKAERSLPDTVTIWLKFFWAI